MLKYIIALLSISLTLQTIAQNKKITNKDIWASRTFSAKNVYGINSMNDGVHFTTLDYDQKGSMIQKARYNSPTQKETIISDAIFEKNGIKGVSIEDYQFNPSESKILIATESEKIYRHSRKYNYYIYDLATKNLQPLTDFSKGKQSLAEFSPTEDKVAFTRKNNLFFVDFTTGK